MIHDKIYNVIEEDYYGEKVVVCMLLDRETAGIIEPLQRKLGRPFPSDHITIATYIGIDADTILEYTRKFCQSHTKFDVEYVGVGVLVNGEPPLIYAAPRMNTELLKHIRNFIRSMMSTALVLLLLTHTHGHRTHR